MRYICDLYYAFLNAGFDIAPSAGSASSFLQNPNGYNRIYVRLMGTEELSFDTWLAALRRGRNFVTNGPLLRCTANGEQVGARFAFAGGGGSLSLSCDVRSAGALDRAEVIVGGRVASTHTAAAGAEALIFSDAVNVT